MEKCGYAVNSCGAFSKIALRDFGVVYGPSEMHLKSPVEHTVLSMSERKINHLAWR